MTLIEMTLHTARNLGADRKGVRLRDLHQAYLRQFPRTAQGRTQESFAATLCYHCINMRWVVRPTPDLRLWGHLSPRDLMVPVDRHVARMAEAIGIISTAEASEPRRATVEKITSWARNLYSDDPARIDYAFFMWGRGRSNSRLHEDTCYCHLNEAGQMCPLAGVLPCGPHCGSLAE